MALFVLKQTLDPKTVTEKLTVQAEHNEAEKSTMEQSTLQDVEKSSKKRIISQS